MKTNKRCGVCRKGYVLDSNYTDPHVCPQCAANLRTHIEAKAMKT